ncbi:hypothetical protein, partial [Escherichia coli]|uniref:hypothetical protein n=1 Tax=Escherichia coli TaxID=562 RepID=UPI001302B4DD
EDYSKTPCKRKVESFFLRTTAAHFGHGEDYRRASQFESFFFARRLPLASRRKSALTSAAWCFINFRPPTLSRKRTRVKSSSRQLLHAFVRDRFRVIICFFPHWAGSIQQAVVVMKRMAQDAIVVRGARVNNLKNISFSIPI